MKSLRFNVLLVACLFISAATFINADALLLWEDMLDLGGLNDAARAVAISNNLAVVVGEGTTASGENPIIRAYDIRTGTLEWSDQAPGLIPGVVIDHSGQVFVAGRDFGVRAYDARTGNRLWEDFPNRGLFAQAIAASHYGVFVVGYGGSLGPGPLDFLVRAYEKETGTLLWEDQVHNAGQDTAAFKVATEGKMAVVAGSIVSATTRELILRGYEASSGRLVWESRAAEVSPFAIAIDAQRVYVGGNGRAGPFLAAYSNETGQLLWQDRTGEVVDLVADRSRLFAAGAAKGLVRAHDARTGRLIWEDQTGTIDDQGVIMNPRAIALGHDLVFVAGFASKEPEFTEFLVRAYDAANGKLLWTDRSHRGLSGAVDIVAQGNGVFAVGQAQPDLVSDQDFLVRGYLAKK